MVHSSFRSRGSFHGKFLLSWRVNLIWVWVKIKPTRGPQVFGLGSIYQGNPFWVTLFLTHSYILQQLDEPAKGLRDATPRRRRNFWPPGSKDSCTRGHSTRMAPAACECSSQLIPLQGEGWGGCPQLHLPNFIFLVFPTTWKGNKSKSPGHPPSPNFILRG